MTELLKFILEGWQNTAAFLLVTTFIGFLLIAVAGAFKPVNITYFNNPIKEQEKEINDES